MTLNELPPQEKAIIRSFSCQPPLKRRLMEMGILIGMTIETVGVSPLGDPIEYKTELMHFSLRAIDASYIEIDKLL